MLYLYDALGALQSGKFFKLLLELELKLDAIAMARGLLSEAALTK